MSWLSARTSNQRDALEQARRLNRELGGGARILTTPEYRVPILEAMETAIRMSRSRTNDHRRNMVSFAHYFLSFLEQKYPGLRHWNDIRPNHVRDYIDALAARPRKLSAVSIKHYVSVISLTSRHYNRDCPELYHVINVSHPALVRTSKPEKNYLSVGDLKFAIGIARQMGEWRAELALYLGGFGGMNLQEIAMRSKGDFDFDEEIVTITKSKNKYRNRRIPMASFVSAAVAEIVRRCETGSDYLVPRTDKHGAQVAGRHNLLANSLRDVYAECRRIRAEEGGLFPKLAPKDVRKTFVNICADCNVSDSDVEAYIGHSPKTVLQKHYKDSDRISYLREHVIAPVYGNARSLEELLPSAKIVAIQGR